MTYKFQRGASILSGSLTQEGNVTLDGAFDIKIDDDRFIGIDSDTDLLQLKDGQFVVAGKALLDNSAAGSEDVTVLQLQASSPNSDGTATFTMNETGSLILNVTGTGPAMSNVHLRAEKRLHLGDGATNRVRVGKTDASNTTAFEIYSGHEGRRTFLVNGSGSRTGDLGGALVGIGLNDGDAPAEKLHLSGAEICAVRLETSEYRSYNVGSDAYGFVIWDATTGGTEGYRFVISDQADALGYVGIGAGASIGGSLHPDALLHLSSSDDGRILQVDDTQESTLLFVTGSGRVGVGTRDPSHEFSVTGSARLNGGLVHKRTAVSANHTASADEYFLGVTSVPLSIQFDATEFEAGQVLVIKDESGNASSANPITLDAFGSQTIDADTSVELESPYASILLYSNGSNWFVY